MFFVRSYLMSSSILKFIVRRNEVNGLSFPPSLSLISKAIEYRNKWLTEDAGMSWVIPA